MMTSHNRMKYRSKHYADDGFTNKKETFLSKEVIPLNPLVLSPFQVTPTKSGFTLTKVKPKSNEYKKVIAQIENTGGDINRIVIYKIEKVNNPYLSAMYKLKKAEMKSIFRNLKEEKLFHGTLNGNSRGICGNNLNYRMSGKSRGVKYGCGVSFSPHFFYSKCFCNKVQNASKVIFLCDVLVGRWHIGSKGLVHPEPGFDTTISDQGEVYVKYDDDSFIPKYKITFLLKY